MIRTRVYIDTSVLGGCFDEEFEHPSNKLIDQFKRAEKILIVSDLMLRELEDAPQEVKDLYNSIPTKFIEFVTLDEEAKFPGYKIY